VLDWRTLTYALPHALAIRSNSYTVTLGAGVAATATNSRRSLPRLRGWISSFGTYLVTLCPRSRLHDEGDLWRGVGPSRRSRALLADHPLHFGCQHRSSPAPLFVVRITLRRTLMRNRLGGHGGHQSACHKPGYRHGGRDMVSGSNFVGSPSMLFMFFRPQYFRMLSAPCRTQCRTRF
jgi:hypothetical protein